MSYQLVELKIENSVRVITDAKPLYLPMGALSGNDITTLKVSVVVGSLSGGTAALTLETSMDGGLTWKAVTTGTDGPITGAGTYQVWMTADSGISGPNIRLKVLPSAGQSMYITKAYKTFTTGDVIIPRDAGSGGGGVGGATEATSLSILLAVDGLETAVASTNTKLDTLHTDIGTTIAEYVDGIETLVGSTNTKLDTLHTDIGTTIAGYVDGIETLVGSTNTKLDTLHTDIGTTIAGYVDGIEGALTTLNAKDFATEATLAKTRKWPYVTYNTIIPTEDVNNEYYTYKNSGGTTVGTITIAKATGIITYSPDKVV